LNVPIDEYNSFESLLTQYRHCISRLSQIGINLSGASRLRTYERSLEQLVLDLRPAIETNLIVAASFDLREIDEIIEIINHLPNPLDKATISILKKMIGGSDHPDAEVMAAARDAQYELFLGAVFRRAGVQAKHGAPDLIVHWRKQDFFIEAKRPSSFDRVDDRLRSAIHQIRRLPSTGIIALSLDQVVRPPGGLLTVKEFGDLSPAVHHLIINFVHNNIGLWRKRLTGEPVSAILMTARIPGRVTSTGHSALGSNIHVELLSIPSEKTDVRGFINYALSAYDSALNESAAKLVTGDKE
jgi:hypothetical protein